MEAMEVADTTGSLIPSLTTQIAQIKEALRSILLLEKSVSGVAESMDAEVAAAITRAFEEHVPSFNYVEQDCPSGPRHLAFASYGTVHVGAENCPFLQLNTPDGKFKTDNAVRGVCFELVRAAADSGEHVMAYKAPGATLPSIPQLLDLARYLAHILLADSVLFLSLIGDLVEACTIDEGTDIFLYLEKCVPFMKAKFNFEPQSSSPKLTVLKVCNQLLRRLSRARHVLLAGRIHLFLAQILPSTDRSAVNANGMVNDTHAVDIEDVAEDTLGADGKPIDIAMYKQFWSLQQVFQNPTKATDPNLWLQVHASIKAVLAEFGRVKPTVISGGINSSNIAGGQEPKRLTVKYLSSPKLLNLQLRDAGFRRHFLVQCLTLLQACSRKSLARQETFRVKQQGESDDLQELLYAELERTPQHGAQFSRAIRSLLHQEDQWADWKADGAKSFERPKRALEEGAAPAAKRRRLTASDTVLMGTRELTRLWNLTPDNLSAISKETRRHKPSLREFLEPVVAEMDPEDGIEEQYKKKNELVYRWEALRQISKVSGLSLSAIVKTPDQNLEEAIRLIFPEDVPAAATKAPADAPALPEETVLGAPPSPAPGITGTETKQQGADGEENAPAPVANGELRESTPDLVSDPQQEAVPPDGAEPVADATKASPERSTTAEAPPAASSPEVAAAEGAPSAAFSEEPSSISTLPASSVQEAQTGTETT